MDFQVPADYLETLEGFKKFLAERLTPNLSSWYSEGKVPRQFFRELGSGHFLGFDSENGSLSEQSTLKQALFLEHLGTLSPGVGVAVLVHISLGTKGISLSETRIRRRPSLPRHHGARSLSVSQHRADGRKRRGGPCGNGRKS